MRVVFAFIILGLCACAHHNPTTPLSPPYTFPSTGSGTSKISFRNETKYQGNYFVHVFEDSKECTGRHFMNLNITNTLNVASQKEFTFLVDYSFLTVAKVTTCQLMYTITPDGSEFIIESNIGSNACSLNIRKVGVDGVASSVVDAQRRTLNHSIFDDNKWCDAR